MQLPDLIKIARHINKVAIQAVKSGKLKTDQYYAAHRYVRRMVRGIHYRMETQSGRQMICRHIGWGSDCHAYLFHYVNGEKPDYVIKVYRRPVNRSNIPSRKNPVAQKFFLYPVWKSRHVLIQPLVDTRRRRSAYSLICKAQSEMKRWAWKDDRHANVGWYNGQPCIIDWNYIYD